MKRVVVASLISFVLLGGCKGSESNNGAFCLNTRDMFGGRAISHLHDARRGINSSDCRPIEQARANLVSTYMGFRAAAQPFEATPEVGRVLAAMDKLDTDELFRIECHDVLKSPEYFAKLETILAAIDPKLRAIAAACTTSD